MSTLRCAIVDYGIGNVFSVMQALKKLDAQTELTSDPRAIAAADRVILPGVGAYGKAAERLRDSGLDQAVMEFVGTGRPFLGICVGMQLLFEIGTEFGEHRGLGLIPGSVDRISISREDGTAIRVPLIGWHPLTPAEGGSYGDWEGTPLQGMDRDAAFYFVHSFSARAAQPENVLAVTRHEGHSVVAAVKSGNVLGTQFHPERSSTHGIAFLDRFLRS